MLAGTLPFVGLDLVVEKYSTLYRAWHLAPPVYSTCFIKGVGPQGDVAEGAEALLVGAGQTIDG